MNNKVGIHYAYWEHDWDVDFVPSVLRAELSSVCRHELLFAFVSKGQRQFDCIPHAGAE
jgi:hypothetical protein